MRIRALTVAALIAVPAVGYGENDGRPEPVPIEKTATPVVGGTDAPLGKWPDAAGILFSGSVGCTGTLIAETVALTAGHCESSDLTGILVGTNSLNRTADGEVLNVTRRVVLGGADITVLVLGQASRFEPRPIASGWARFDIKNGAPVAIVGYGATTRQGGGNKAELQEAMSTITDFNCSVKAGCDQNELGAGGNGIDSCFGDSGGPLYLVTSYGDFLVGVTSRGYSDANDPCGEGGIYGRPDLLVAEIETAAGRAVAHGPEPTAERVVAIRGDAGETSIVANDPKGTSHSFTLTTPPARATAVVREDGRVRVCVNADAPPGDSDSFVVTVADKADPTRAIQTKVGIAVAENEPVDGPCDPNAFDDGGGDGGCCDSGRGGISGSATLSLFVVLVVLRRRRR